MIYNIIKSIQSLWMSYVTGYWLLIFSEEKICDNYTATLLHNFANHNKSVENLWLEWNVNWVSLSETWVCDEVFKGIVKWKSKYCQISPKSLNSSHTHVSYSETQFTLHSSHKFSTDLLWFAKLCNSIAVYLSHIFFQKI